MGNQTYVTPESVLASLYGKTSIELSISENRRDEVIAAAIFTSFRNHEFGTKFKLPADYRHIDRAQDSSGIDMIVSNSAGRNKKLQIKGVHIQRSIERRKRHQTKGGPRIMGRRTRRMVQDDSEELTSIMKEELEKITQDYRGMVLVIHVIADFATQTSLEIAVRRSLKVVEKIKANEVWILRHIPVLAIHGKRTPINYYSFQIIKVSPDRRTYGFSFAL